MNRSQLQSTSRRSINPWNTTVAIVAIIIIIILCVGMIFIGRKIPLVVIQISSLWRELVYQLAFWSLIQARGNVGEALILIALGTWIVTQLLASLVKAVMQFTNKQFYANQSVIDSVSMAHVKLKQLFNNDIEKIAFYENRLHGKEIKGSPGCAPTLGCGGCLLSLVLSILGFPISLSFGLMTLEVINQVFLNNDKASFMSIYSLDQRLLVSKYFPLPTSIYGVQLNEKSLPLLVICGVLVIVLWALTNLTVTGWKIPRPHKISWITYVAFLILSYFLLNGALLIFATIYLIIQIIVIIIRRFLWRGAYLRLRSLRIKSSIN